MKKTILILAAAFLATVSCSDSKKLPDDGIYGEIPGIMQELSDKIEAEMYEAFGKNKEGDKSVQEKTSFAEALALAMILQNEYEERFNAAAGGVIESMKGKKLPFVMGDGVPYTIDKDVTITNIKYGSKGITINAEMDVTMQQEVISDFVRFYFLVETDTTALIQSSKSVEIKPDMGFKAKPADEEFFHYNKYIIKKGDKLHVDFDFCSEKCTPEMMAMCKRLKFVTEEEYNRSNVSKTVKKMLKAQKEKEQKENPKKE